MANGVLKRPWFLHSSVEEPSRMCGCNWRLLKGKGKYKGSMVECRWNLLAKRGCFSFSDAFKTYPNPWRADSHPMMNKWGGAWAFPSQVHVV
jgi:hypothetical protein